MHIIPMYREKPMYASSDVIHGYFHVVPYSILGTCTRYILGPFLHSSLSTSAPSPPGTGYLLRLPLGRKEKNRTECTLLLGSSCTSLLRGLPTKLLTYVERRHPLGPLAHCNSLHSLPLPLPLPHCHPLHTAHSPQPTSHSIRHASSHGRQSALSPVYRLCPGGMYNPQSNPCPP